MWNLYAKFGDQLAGVERPRSTIKNFWDNDSSMMKHKFNDYGSTALEMNLALNNANPQVPQSALSLLQNQIKPLLLV